MSKLCLGTFLTAIIKCKAKSYTQKFIVGEIMHSIDYDFDEEDDAMISNIVAGRKNPSDNLLETAKSITENNYPNLISNFTLITNVYLDPNKIDTLYSILIKIISGDTNIKDSTIVDIISNTKKKDLHIQIKTINYFLAGVFIYILKYTNNTECNVYVKEINDEFIQIANLEYLSVDKRNKNTHKLNNDNINDDEIETKARQFCVKYENELSLLPLCEIACYVDPLHKNMRELFNEYNLCSKNVQSRILSLKKLPILNFPDKWISTAMSKYKKALETFKLADSRFLYVESQYLHRAFYRYYNFPIEDYDPYIFERPFKDKYISQTLNYNGLTSLAFYISDYLFYAKEEPDKLITPPFDYLWQRVNLAECEESYLTFWACKFIIDSSYQIESDDKLEDKHWANVSICDDLLQTQEDVYYYALLQLYRLYIAKRNQ